MNISKLLSTQEIDDLKSMADITQKYKSAYIAVNINAATTTRYPVVANSTTYYGYKYRWELTNTKNIQTGSVNMINKVRNIIGISMPAAPAILYNYPATGLPSLTGIMFEEFSSQAIESPTGQRFHFILNGNNVSGHGVDDTTSHAYGHGLYKNTFWFSRPFSQISTITILPIALAKDTPLDNLDHYVPAPAVDNTVFHLQLIYLDEEEEDE
jgi:hypothetical protein